MVRSTLLQQQISKNDASGKKVLWMCLTSKSVMILSPSLLSRSSSDRSLKVQSFHDVVIFTSTQTQIKLRSRLFTESDLSRMIEFLMQISSLSLHFRFYCTDNSFRFILFGLRLKVRLLIPLKILILHRKISGYRTGFYYGMRGFKSPFSLL